MTHRVRFRKMVCGLLLESGREMVFLPGEEADLTIGEYRLLPAGSFENLARLGLPMDLSGEIVRCTGECRKVWRRSAKLKNVTICSACAMADDSRVKAKMRHLNAI